jgi:predicted phage replisome organizer
MISWIKLDINILDDAKIKIIRSHPNGDSVVLLWIGLLCLAMKSSRPGTIEISDGLPYTVDDLSNLFNIEKKTVEMGLALFVKYRMVETFEGGSIEVINFSKHQKLDEIERKRELTRARTVKYRELLRIGDAGVTRRGVTVTLTDLDLDLDKDLDKEKKENKEKKEKKSPPPKNKFLDSVYLTEGEHQKLQEVLGQKSLDIGIEQLDYSITVKGGKYQDHYKTLLNWFKRGFLNGNGDGKRPGTFGSQQAPVTKTGGAKSDDRPYPIDAEY